MDGYQYNDLWIKHCFICDGYYTYYATHWESLHSDACRDCVRLSEEARRNLEAKEREARIKYVQDGYVLLMPVKTH